MGSYFRDFYSPKASQRPTVGDTKFSVTFQDHMGWLKCDGRQLAVSDYNILFQMIGYRFGGSGNQFTLPDAEGRVPGAIGTSTDHTWTLGDVSGQETHTLIIDEMPAHKHGSADVTGNTNGNGITDLSGAHTHSGITEAQGYAQSFTGVSGADVLSTNVADNAGDHTHAFTTGQPSVLHHHKIGSTGGSAAHNNMQPTIFIGNLFIYSGRPRVGSYPYTSSYPAAIGGIVL